MPKPPRVYKTPAIVLRQRKLGDADKIITLYTANRGKLDAVAKGVRRVKSRLAGNVEPLSHGSYLVAQGRNLDIITQAQSIESFQALRDDLGRLSHALYAAELVDRATEERSDNFALYRLLLDTLRRLAQREDLDTTLRFFEMSLLDQLGYRPELERCVMCSGPLAEDAPNVWSPGQGGAVCRNCRPANVAITSLSSGALATLRLLQTGSHQKVAGLPLDGDLAAEVERDLRDAIHYALDCDIRSASFLDEVRRQPARSPGAGHSP